MDSCISSFTGFVAPGNDGGLQINLRPTANKIKSEEHGIQSKPSVARFICPVMRANDPVKSVKSGIKRR